MGSGWVGGRKNQKTNERATSVWGPTRTLCDVWVRFPHGVVSQRIWWNQALSAAGGRGRCFGEFWVARGDRNDLKLVLA